MPYSVEYDEQGIIRIKVQGTLTVAVVDDMARDVVHLAKEKNCFRVLNDLREATLKVSMVDVYNFPNEFSEITTRAGLHVYQFKRALIPNDDEKLLTFFENVSRNRHQNLRLFHDVASAQQWLLEE
jgi:hypothetical protein